MQPVRWVTCAAILLVALAQAQATVLDFEDSAPFADGISVGPSAPYTEDGYTFTAADFAAAVVDAAAIPNMPGNSASDWFGFGESNTITLTYGGGAFDLHELLLGPNNFAETLPMQVTLTGFYQLGGSVTSTYSGLSTATLVTPGWANLSSVQFTASDDAALDNLSVTAVPEPGTLALLGFGALGLAWRRRRGD